MDKVLIERYEKEDISVILIVFPSHRKSIFSKYKFTITNWISNMIS